MAGLKPMQRIRAENPAQVRRLLNRCINGLFNDEIEESRARTVGYLCSILLTAYEKEDIAKRLDSLEEAMEARTA